MRERLGPANLMNRPVIIMGTTAYSEVFLDSFSTMPGLVIAGFLENQDLQRCNSLIAGKPVYWHSNVSGLISEHDFICPLGTTLRRQWVEEVSLLGASFSSFINPSAVVSRKTILEDGCSLDAGVVVAGFSHVERHVRIGRRAAIGHHVKVGSYCTIHPGVIISGYCDIGSQVTIGAGAIILERISIGDGAVIAAGAVVRKSVPSGALAAGHPSRIVKSNYGPI